MSGSFTVHGRLALDLTGLIPGRDDHRLMRAVQSITEAPASAAVVITVSPRQNPPRDAIWFVRQHGRHLDTITVESESPAAVRAWIDALSGEGGPA